MSAVLFKHYYTPEEYLALEREKLEGKAEYIDGQIFAMAGASRKHILITVNIGRELSLQLKGRPGETYASEMRVKSTKSKAYFYPDISVVCGKPELEDSHNDTLTNPTLVIEVLSPSTEAFDRGGKFARYRRIESLLEYYLVSQDQALIEKYVRQGESWLLTEISGLDETVNLESIGCALAMKEVYDRVSDGFSDETDEPEIGP